MGWPGGFRLASSLGVDPLSFPRGVGIFPEANHCAECGLSKTGVMNTVYTSPDMCTDTGKCRYCNTGEKRMKQAESNGRVGMGVDRRGGLIRCFQADPSFCDILRKLGIIERGKCGETGQWIMG